VTRGVPGSTPGCGTVARYAAGCRCEACRAEKARIDKWCRLQAAKAVPRRFPSVGTRRRLQALAAIGWSAEELGARLGITAQALRRTRSHEGPVERRTHERVIALYDEISMTPGPSKRARSLAVRNGWAPPLAWDDDALDDPNAEPAHTTARERSASSRVVDEIAVERAITGDRVPLTILERERVIEALVRRGGLSDRQIAEQIGCWPETILRVRRRLGLETRWVAA
jgi:transcriptional regulator with XRE-family HTH domain